MRSTLLLALAVAACSSGSTSSPPPCSGLDPAATRACLNDRYFSGYGADTKPACEVVPTGKQIAGKKELGLFVGVGSSELALQSETQRLQRFYSPYGLQFFATRPAVGSVLTYALVGTSQQFADIERKAGVQPGTTPTADQQKQLQRLAADLIFADIRSFVASESNPRKNRIDIVVLPHIASPDVASGFLGGVIAGIGLSPEVFRNIASDDPSKNLFDLLALPPDFTPVFFIGHDDIEKLATNKDIVVAHEMGHALGLPHTTEPGNLMTQYSANRDCRSGLRDPQIAIIQADVDPNAMVLAEPMRSGAELVATALQQWASRPR